MGTPVDLRSELERLHADAWAWACTCCRGDVEQGEDVLHAAYLGVLDGRIRFGQRSSFKTWLFGVVRRAALEHRRRSWRRAGLLAQWLAAREEREVPAAGERAESEERGARVRAALEQLSARQRDVAELVFYHGLTLRDAADVLGVSLGSVKTHYDRGKRELRRLLASELES